MGDGIQWVYGSPKKTMHATFVFHDASPWGRDSKVVASGWHTRYGWRLEWHANDGACVIFGRVTVAAWKDVLALLRLGPVAAARRLQDAIDAASATADVNIIGLGN